MSSTTSTGGVVCTKTSDQDNFFGNPRICKQCDGGGDVGCRGYELRCLAGAFLTASKVLAAFSAPHFGLLSMCLAR